MRNIIGIRKENAGAEHRAPLAPDHVRALVDKHRIRVVVEPSDTRIVSDREYAEAGATLSADMSDCALVLGVKEISVEDIQQGQAYCYFSHTIKAQRYNMPMLSRIIDTGASLLDYELVTNESGRRIIFFGDFAGYAGMIDTLWALGRRLDWEGVSNPFASIKQAIDYDDLAEAEDAVRHVGDQIRAEGLPDRIAPFVCIFTGRGQVSKAAQRMFSLLPVVNVKSDDLESLFSQKEISRHAVYATEFNKPELYRPRDPDTPFSNDDFLEHPNAYRGNLHNFIEHATIIVNGIYWSPQYPRLLTRAFLQTSWAGSSKTLRVIGDITCDIEGSIEFTTKSTTSENPVFVYEPKEDRIVDGFAGDGPVVLAVDNLPVELPRASTISFGDALMPYIPQLARCDFSRPSDEIGLPAPFARALIAHNGHLTDNFRYLNSYLLRSE